MLWLLCVIATAVAIPSPDRVPTKKSFEGYEVLEITPKLLVQHMWVHKLGEDLELDMWKEGRQLGDSSQLMVPPHRLAQVKKSLRMRQITFTVYIENVQTLIEAEEAELKRNKKAFDYDQYNELDDIMAEIYTLEANCPSGYTCATETIGSSYEGRDIVMLSIADGNKPAVWIDSTIHAREWLAPATVFKFMQRLWTGEGDTEGLLSRYNWYFVPMMNPDGYLFTWTDNRMWRKSRNANSGSTCMGTDLNRNYETHWSESGTSNNPCSDTFHGSGAGSEPETECVQDKAVELDLVAFVSTHTHGEYWLHPWGNVVSGSCNIADDEEDLLAASNAAADAAGAAVSGGNTWRRGNSCATIYAASGLTIEYAKEPGGTKYTFTPELSGGSFTPPASQIDPSDREYYAAISAQMDVIDQREGLNTRK